MKLVFGLRENLEKTTWQHDDTWHYSEVKNKTVKKNIKQWVDEWCGGTILSLRYVWPKASDKGQIVF